MNYKHFTLIFTLIYCTISHATPNEEITDPYLINQDNNKTFISKWEKNTQKKSYPTDKQGRRIHEPNTFVNLASIGLDVGEIGFFLTHSTDYDHRPVVVPFSKNSTIIITHIIYENNKRAMLITNLSCCHDISMQLLKGYIDACNQTVNSNIISSHVTLFSPDNEQYAKIIKEGQLTSALHRTIQKQWNQRAQINKKNNRIIKKNGYNPEVTSEHFSFHHNSNGSVCPYATKGVIIFEPEDEKITQISSEASLLNSRILEARPKKWSW
jgi:hypothetical protein